MAKAKTEVKTSTEFKKPTLRLKESTHYNGVWFPKENVELRESKNGKDFYVVIIEGNEIMFGEKALIGNSKDGLKKGFHVQNSRGYRIFGTSEMITGKDLIQYSIQLAQFEKQEKANK